MSRYAWFLIALALPGSVSAQLFHITGSIFCAGHLELVNSGPSLQGESSGRSVHIRIKDAGEDRLTNASRLVVSKSNDREKVVFAYPQDIRRSVLVWPHWCADCFHARM